MLCLKTSNYHVIDIQVTKLNEVFDDIVYLCGVVGSTCVFSLVIVPSDFTTYRSNKILHNPIT